MSNRSVASGMHAPPGAPGKGPIPGLGDILLRADAAWRLGPRAVGLFGWHRLARRLGRTLADAPRPAGPFLAATPAAPALCRDLHGPNWHGPFDPTAPALAMDLFGPGDVRPVWEGSRLVEVLRLPLPEAEALLADWVSANPPFRGPNWACGQEAALRALHLALALHGPASPGLRALLALHARRILATTAYAQAQDNNHPVSEAAGLFACGLVLGDAGLATRAARRLSRTVARLVSPCGTFAPVSPAYQRLLVDVLWAAEALRRRHGAAAFDAAFPPRAMAATTWLARLACPTTGALPRIGHCDGSAFADVAGAGPDDARPSIARAAALFGAGPEDGADWVAEGLRGWSRQGARAILRCGPIRFRPAQADLLHLDLWNGPVAVLRDGGTGAYNPAEAWWLSYFPGTAAHNTIAFDDQDQMPRAGRFLFARWPKTEPLADGGAITDHAGRRHERRVTADGRDWRVEDRIAGPFSTAVLRWRLAPGPWQATADGVAGPRARLHLAADAPCTVAIETGHESLAYGQVRPCPVLTLRASAGARRIVTRITLPGQAC